MNNTNKANKIMKILAEAEGDFSPKEKELIDQGYIYKKDYHPFGRAPIFKKGNDFKFFYMGEIMTPQEVYDDLVQNWEPHAEDDVSWKMDHMKSYFSPLGVKV